MISFLLLIFLFIYSVSIFLINNFYILLLIFIFNLIVSFIFKVKIKDHINLLKNNLIFITFIIICNILFSPIKESLLVGLRLFLVIDYTYIMGSYFNSENIREAFYYLLYPLKIFKINISELTLIIAIALSFIPIFTDELRMIKSSLKSKGFEFNLKNALTKPHIYTITFLNNLFDRVDELEKSLITKGF